MTISLALNQCSDYRFLVRTGKIIDDSDRYVEF